MTGNVRATHAPCDRNRFLGLALAVAILCGGVQFASAAGPASEAAIKSAWALYTQGKYRESSDAFEGLIATSTPNPRLYYYAALALRACNRNARAKQLCQYITSTFPRSAEAAYSQRIFPSAPTQVASGGGEGGGDDSEPEQFRGKSPDELIKTDEGRRYLSQKLTKRAIASASPAMQGKTGRRGDRVFTASDIARDGANGIDQMHYPNCWFESSMSALAMLPRGQRLMADMVSYGDKEGSYVVRFPGDGNIYNVTDKEIEQKGIHDKALWATLIECGQTQKFPDDNGAQIQEGLAYLTGQRAEVLAPGEASDQDLSSFIGGAVSSGNPIVCGSHHGIPAGAPPIVVTGHAYTIIGFEPASGLIRIRNPHGRNSQRFDLKGDPSHRKFEQMDDGVFKIHISIFKQLFSTVARAFI